MPGCWGLRRLAAGREQPAQCSAGWALPCSIAHHLDQRVTLFKASGWAARWWAGAPHPCVGGCIPHSATPAGCTRLMPLHLAAVGAGALQLLAHCSCWLLPPCSCCCDAEPSLLAHLHALPPPSLPCTPDMDPARPASRAATIRAAAQPACSRAKPRAEPPVLSGTCVTSCQCWRHVTEVCGRGKQTLQTMQPCRRGMRGGLLTPGSSTGARAGYSTHAQPGAQR